MEKRKIFPVNPYFFKEDIEFITERVREILEGKSFLSQYKYCEEFEDKFSTYIGRAFAITTCNGTSAIELMLRSLEIENGEIIVPTNTNVCTAFPVVRTGNRPVFADCSKDLTLDPESVREKITEKTRAVITVHIGGLVSPNTYELLEICEEKGIPLLEDAAHAHGALLDGMKGGSFGVASAFSFFSTKVMTTGEGGMFLTDIEEVAERGRILRNIGKVSGKGYDYYHEEIAYNWKMSEITALLGLTQLKHLEVFVKRRNEIAQILNEELDGVDGIEVLEIPKNCRSSFYKYIVFLDKGIDKKRLLEMLKVEYDIRLGASVYDLPLHMQPAFKQFADGHLPTAEDLCPRHICLSNYYTMTDEDAVYEAECLKKCLKVLRKGV